MVDKEGVRHDDVFLQMQQLARQQSWSALLQYAQDMHQKGLLETDYIPWLFTYVRQWHTEELLKEQTDACLLVLQSIPEHAEALHLLGFNAQAQGEFAEAENYYKRALISAPHYAFSKLALAQIHLMLSGFAEGKKEYESRFDAVTEGSSPDWRGLPIVRWQGESITGKQLYIWAEQGLGDIIMFSGFLPHLVAQMPKRLVLGMFPKLVSLFSRSFPAITIEPIEAVARYALAPAALTAWPHLEQMKDITNVPFPLEPLRKAYDYAQIHGIFDYSAPLGDILLHCMPEHVSCGKNQAYLVSDPARVTSFRQKLDRLKPGKRVGISWHTHNIRESFRNIPLKDWLPILKTPGYTFIALQHGVAQKEINQFCQDNDCNIWVDSCDFMQDAESLVALTSLMDEVITIDNSNAHIAGALGIKTKLLLPKGHNYRWPPCSKDGTLWYKTVTTFRQEKAFQWKSVITQVTESLAIRHHHDDVHG